ncbi:S-layer homology domain-containing protein [uncultured Planococcus sp.]|uniref:S-layer homology domain-containing protein n=1 Tax=uncultured Planococcus sp. TaxID=337815 RepID=UPI002634E3EB|nr:S-layer homology domain-containing protein [uncultured Planococcus sp.]
MKKTLILSSAVLAFSLMGTPALAASDLPENHRFYDEIDYLVDKKVITGYEDGTFRPDKTVTRAEAAIMIGQLKDLDGTQRATGFKDVSKSSKASGYIAAAQEAGYLNGYPDKTFRPDAPITRGDMAILLSNIFTMPLWGATDFKDVSANMKAFEPIKQLVSYNITAGYPDRTYRPLTNVTRGQFSAFLARGLEPVFKNDTHMENSYLRDKTKVYSYRSADGVVLNARYTDDSHLNGEPLGFLWENYNEDVEDIFYTEDETYDMYNIGFPFSEYITELVYPIKKGKVFNIDNPFAPVSKITGVDVTVKTPYKTFTNAVEVTVPYDSSVNHDTGYKYYMVEGFGAVKTVGLDGKISSELIKVQ